ncbi:MAG: hypothetical protein HYX54_01535 [Chloroflexi bacterium]|nr:hypothetical protein [Chloroflexota bacterium]
MDEHLTLDDRVLLRRLDAFFAAEVESAERDFEALADATPQIRGRIRTSNHSSLRLVGTLGLIVALILAVAPTLDTFNAPTSGGSSTTSNPAARDITASIPAAVVVATADGAAIVRLDGEVVELLVTVRTGDAWAVSAVDRTLRIPSGSEAAGQEANGWYLAGNAVVCDPGSGLRDRGFIYGWLASGPGPDRMELTGIPVRGDGRLVNGLYLFAARGTPVTGASYALTPVDRAGLAARQPIELQGTFGIPAPVTCGVPQDAGAPEVPASISGLIPAPSGSVEPAPGRNP